VQEQLIWNDRLFVTGAVRADDNSAFGTNFDVVTYPKLSASYVLSEEPSIPLPVARQLAAAARRLRRQWTAARRLRRDPHVRVGGRRRHAPVGRQPGPGPRGELRAGARPRRGLRGRPREHRPDVLQRVHQGRDPVASGPSVGGLPGLQFFNAGRVNRNGLELLLRGHPIRSERFGLELTASGSTNNYEIVDLGAGTNLISVTGQVQHVVGYAPGAWWDRRVVSADRNAAGQATNLRCDDGQGGQVACASAPRVFLGNTVPTREGSLSATLTLLRDLRLTAFFDYRGGYKKLDGNRRARCNLFSLCRENYFPQEFDAVTLAEVQGGTAFTYNLIQDASFTRFRELSLNYSLPAGLVRRAGVSRAAITVAGRNLGLWTNYGGLEPEASFNGGTRGGFGQWEQNVLPQTRQFVATLNLSF
jgi:hypothetical protein